MWEFEVVINGEKNSFFIWGYSFQDACNRNHFKPSELVILFQDYVD